MHVSKAALAVGVIVASALGTGAWAQGVSLPAPASGAVGHAQLSDARPSDTLADIAQFDFSQVTRLPRTGAGPFFAFDATGALPHPPHEAADESHAAIAHSSFDALSAPAAERASHVRTMDSTPIPLPTALWMGVWMLGGLGAIGLLRRGWASWRA